MVFVFTNSGSPRWFPWFSSYSGMDRKPSATAEEAATVWKQMTEPTYEVVY